MFEHNFANRCKAGKISVHDIFDDIKLTAGGDELLLSSYKSIARGIMFHSLATRLKKLKRSSTH